LCAVGQQTGSRAGDDSNATETSEEPESLEPSPPLEPDAAEPLEPPPPEPDTAEQETVEQGSDSDTVLATIERLAELHRSGILTDEEFAKRRSICSTACRSVETVQEASSVGASSHWAGLDHFASAN
jgi:hypothetical protein